MKGPKHSVRGYPGEVVLVNIVDTWDECIFETPMELASFIEELREAGERAFGTEMSSSQSGGSE